MLQTVYSFSCLFAFLLIVPSSQGYYKSVSGAEYDWEKQAGDVYTYFSFGVACSKVLIDLDTGDYRTLSSDILMDVGRFFCFFFKTIISSSSQSHRSLNPAIDIGQIEGAFLQGVGLFTTERVAYTKEGVLTSDSLNSYNLPSVKNVPDDFNVFLWEHSVNHKAVHASKAIGGLNLSLYFLPLLLQYALLLVSCCCIILLFLEPPLFLGYSVFGAIKDAIYNATNQKYFRLNSPALPSSVLAAVHRKN